MDKGAIRKIIEFSGQSCPAFKYNNPLLDKNVADLLAQGFVKLLNETNSNQDHRHLLMKNIRRTCKVEPSDHLGIDDDVTEILQNTYEELLNDQNNNTTDSDKILDSFLMRQLKEMNIRSLHPPSLTPDVIQALANLKGKKNVMQDILIKDIIYWNINDDKENSQYLAILKSMWNFNSISKTKTKSDDISLKMKPEIEKLLLTSCFEILETEIIDLEEWFFDKKELVDLVNICSISCECFQICSSIMNSLFIKTDFDRLMKKFIGTFISLVKDKCSAEINEMVYFSLLYPIHLRHIVILLDIRLNNLSGNTRKSYINYCLEMLHKLHGQCENDLIMLLSHFNQWFDLYQSGTVKLEIDVKDEIKMSDIN